MNRTRKNHCPRLAFAVAFGRQLRQIRTRLGLSQRDLCERAGMSNGYLSDLENGKRGVSLYTQWQLSQALGVGWDEIKPEQW